MCLTLLGTGSLFRKYPLAAIEVFEGRPIADLQDEYRNTMQSYASLAECVRLPNLERWVTGCWERLTFDVFQDYHIANGIDAGVFSDSREFDRVMEAHEALLGELGYLHGPVDSLQLEDNSNVLPVNKESVIERMRHIPPGENYSFVDGSPWQVVGKGISFIYRRTIETRLDRRSIRWRRYPRVPLRSRPIGIDTSRNACQNSNLSR